MYSWNNTDKNNINELSVLPLMSIVYALVNESKAGDNEQCCDIRILAKMPIYE